jgi:hypothetical protein
MKPEPPALAGTSSFVAYGDMPYRVKMADGRTDEQVLTDDIAPKIRQRDDIAFVIHLGDLGRPEFACSDDWLEYTKAFWRNELRKPVFYTPGDNEWLDCDRETLAVRSKPAARLDAIRHIFFSEPKKLASGWRYEEQLGLPENETWWLGGIRFVSQNIVDEGNDQPVGARQLLNQLWLDHAFDLAETSDTVAVVVATQTDVFGESDPAKPVLPGCTPAYKDFCTHLQDLASALNKPVLLIYGDTNAYCLDQPFATRKATNLWRLNAPGDYQVIDAAVIAFDPSSAAQPFKVTSLLSGKPAPGVCDFSRH